MTVRTLKESFKSEFGGTLRVYNGRELADDGATLAAIRKVDDVKTGEYVCRANRTVGAFEKEMKEVFGIRIQVASPDDWILALDGITLANLRNIKRNATKADMEELVAYKRNAKAVAAKDVEADDIVESEEYGCQLEKLQPLEAGRASLALSDVKAQDDFYFLYIPFNECCVDDYIDTLKNEDNEADIARSKAVLHDQIGGTISDIDCGETVAHDTCGILENDGVYVEIKDNGRYGWEVDNEVSKAYLVIDGKVVYGDVYGDYSESSGRYGYGCRLNKFQRIEAGRSFQRPNKIKSQDGFTFLYIPGFDVENWLYTIQCDESEEDIAKTKAAIHSEIRDIICDIKNGENISHQMCDILDEDGAYIEVKHLLTTDEISKVYLVYWGDVAYGDVFNRYSESDDKYGPFTDEIVGE
jgi:hypothetical protein